MLLQGHYFQCFLILINLWLPGKNTGKEKNARFKISWEQQNSGQLLLHRLQQQPFASITSVLQHSSFRNRFYWLRLQQSNFPMLAVNDNTHTPWPSHCKHIFQADITCCREKSDPGEQEMGRPCITFVNQQAGTQTAVTESLTHLRKNLGAFPPRNTKTWFILTPELTH